MYQGTSVEVAKEVYAKSISKADIPRGLFYDNKNSCYIIHKTASTYFDRAVKLARYSFVGVYNRDTTVRFIQDDIEAL